MPDDTQTPPPAQPALSENQRADFAKLLARHLPRGNIASLASSALGRSAMQEAGNEIGDTAAFARRIIDVLDDAGRIPAVVALLRQEAHRNSRLILYLNHILTGNRLDDDAALQAFINQHEPFFSAASIQEVFPRVLRTVCAVALGEPFHKIVGSGFLIAADLVMTNYHVVEPFLKIDPPGSGSIKADAPGSQLFCFFDYLSEPAPPVPPGNVSHTSIAVRAADDWLIYARTKLAKDGTPDSPAHVDKEFDYAVIKLEKPIGTLPARRGGGATRGWLSLPQTIDVLSAGQRIIIFQHPGTAPQQFDIGDFVQLDPSLTRVWYSVSTAKGSSGGAAVDSQGKLFALHNAEVEANGPAKRLNQGVRIDLIAKDLMAELPPGWDTPPADDKESGLFWSLNDDPQNPQPIIGRAKFRKLVAGMSAPVGERVVVVTGPQGSGVQYSIKLLRRTLGAHVPVVAFSPKDLQNLTPQQFLQVLIDELGVIGTAGKPIPPLLSTENVARWLRLDLPKWLAERLARDEQRDRTRYPVWVVINTVVPSDERLLWAENLKDFVAALAGVHDPGQPSVDVPQLRWLFLGSTTNAMPVSGTKQHDEDLENYSSYDSDFAECLELAWRSIVDKQAPEQTVEMLKGMAQVVRDFADAGKVSLRKALADSVRTIIIRAPKK